MSIEDNDPTVYEFVEIDEAIRRVKRAKAGVWFWIVVSQFAPKKGQQYPKGDATIMGFPVQTIVRVSRRQAWKFIEDAYGYRRSNSTVQLGQSKTALFIGRGAL